MKSEWDFGTVIGLVSGVICIFVAMVWPEGDTPIIIPTEGGGFRWEQLGWFFQPQSVFIVVGGVLCATLVNYPLKAVLGLGKVFKNVILSEKFDFTGMIDNIVVLAEKSRKDGLLSLESGLSEIDSVFLRNGVELAINERDSSRLRIRDPNATFTVGSSVKTTALADLANLVIDGNGTFNVPELTTKTINITSSGTQVSASGDLTLTTELEVNSGTTFNANTNTIAAKNVDVNGGTLDLRNSTLNFYTGASDVWAMTSTSTLTTGNTTVTGANAGTPAGTPIYMPTSNASSSNFEIVGDVDLLVSYGETDLTVIGSVTNCTKNSDASIIRQWHHTLDTQQLLDADEAGDDDLRLTKPALDNALELMTK